MAEPTATSSNPSDSAVLAGSDFPRYHMHVRDIYENTQGKVSLWSQQTTGQLLVVIL
jgi:hypothetical protein